MKEQQQTEEGKTRRLGDVLARLASSEPRRGLDCRASLQGREDQVRRR